MARTTTDPDNWKFTFTITDLARFLGKSPVTLRGWERQGLISVPRDSGGDRKLCIDDIQGIAIIAREKGRITRRRLRIIDAALLMLENVELENSRRK